MKAKPSLFALFTAVHILFFGAFFAYASHHRNLAEALDSARHEGQQTDGVGVGIAIRRAENAEAFALLTAMSYVLSTGTLVAFRPVSLISGNLLFLMVLLLLLEGTTHILGLRFPALGHPSMSGTRGLWVYDQTKGWFHAPGTIAENYVSGPDRGQIRINSLGFRGKEVAKDRAEKLRVLVFGDSFVFGAGVDEPNILTSHLEQLLSRLYPGGVEVVNMGIPGYSTDQEYLLWEELGVKLDPHIVILVVCGNDYVMNSQNFVYGRYYKPYFDVDDFGNLSLKNVPVPRLSTTQRVKVWFCQESNLWNFVRSRESSYSTIQNVINRFHVDVSRPPRRPYKATRAILRRFASSVEQCGAQFLVTSTGSPGGNPGIFASLATFLDEQQIHNVDFYPKLREASEREPDRLWIFENNMHWNRDGHKLAAQAVFNYIQEHFLEDNTNAQQNPSPTP